MTGMTSMTSQCTQHITTYHFGVEYPRTACHVYHNLHSLAVLPCRFLDASEETVDYRLLAMKMALSSETDSNADSNVSALIVFFRSVQQLSFLARFLQNQS